MPLIIKLLSVVYLCVFWILPLQAQEINHDFDFFHLDFWTRFGRMTTDIVSSPLRWDSENWKTAGKYTAMSVALLALDNPIREFSQRNRTPLVNRVVRIGDEMGGNRIWGPLGLALAFGDEKMKRTIFLASQSATITKIYFTTLNLAIPRSRPIDGQEWESGESFPSGHTSFAWSLASVIATEYDDVPIVGKVAYGIATMVILHRVNTDVHWISDSVVGAFIGYNVGKAVSSWAKNEDQNNKTHSWLIIPNLSPDKIGIQLTAFL